MLQHYYMISIIIPSYNSERHLRQCLESITKQTYSDLEVICVDDSSTDNTQLILKQFASTDPRINIITNPINRGISESRNIGMKAARGEWIMFVDSDDWIAPDNCEQALNIASCHDADTLMWCYIREFDSKSLPKVFETNQRVWAGEDVRNIRRRMVGPYREELSRPDLLDAWGTIWGKLYSRRIIESGKPTTFIDTNKIGTAEDVIFNIDYLAKAKKVVYVPQPWYHYRKSMDSYSNIHRADLNQKWDKLFDEMELRLKEEHWGDDFQEALRNRIALGTMGLSIISFRGKGTFKERYNGLKAILRQERQHNALKQLNLDFFPLHWKLYYFAARHKMTPLFMMLQSIINSIIEKH